MRQFKRTDRIADVVQREIADILQRGIKDPRFSGIVSVSAVDVSRDLSYAKIYVTQLDATPEAIKNNIKILNHAAGYFRSELGQRIKLRIIPQLKFIYDESVSHGAYLSGLIDSALAKSKDNFSDNDE